MEFSERSLLLDHAHSKVSNKLSLIFAIICIVDVFGVFPVVTLPKAILDCGIYGPLVIAGICSIQIYTAILLGKCWILAEELDPTIETKNRYPYAALAEITYGPTLSKLVSLLLDVTVFCGGIPNLIVASQNLELLGLRLSTDTFEISFCFWIVILGVIICPVLWLGSPKDMKLLSSISVGMVVLVFVLVIGCLLFTAPIEAATTTPEMALWELILVSYGIITFQFDIHPTILTIQVDMQQKSKLNYAIFAGFIISLVMFALVTLAAMGFGSSVGPSILETLPTTIPLHFAAMFVAVQLCLSSAISNTALYQHVEECMDIPRGVKNEYDYKYYDLFCCRIQSQTLRSKNIPHSFRCINSRVGSPIRFGDVVDWWYSHEPTCLHLAAFVLLKIANTDSLYWGFRKTLGFLSLCCYNRNKCRIYRSCHIRQYKKRTIICKLLAALYIKRINGTDRFLGLFIRKG